MISSVCYFHPLSFADGLRRTDKTAEMTSYTLGAYNAGLSGLGIEDDSLMATILT